MLRQNAGILLYKMGVERRTPTQNIPLPHSRAGAAVNRSELRGPARCQDALPGNGIPSGEKRAVGTTSGAGATIDPLPRCCGALVL